MSEIIMERTIQLGRINYLGEGHRPCPAEVHLELRRCGGNGKPEYVEFSATGTIWTANKKDCWCAGQCLDTIAEYIHTPLYAEIVELWHRYHLNGMHAGTPYQESLLEDFWADKEGYHDYSESKEYLREHNALDVLYTGKSVSRMYDHEVYTYGTDWLVEDIPADDLKRIKQIIQEEA